MDFLGSVQTKEDLQNALMKMGEQMMLRMKQEQKQKADNYRYLNQAAVKGQTLFTGSSLMEQFPVCELWADQGIPGKVYNRGIGGYTTDDFLKEIDTVLFDLEPSKIFINIGTNDMRVWEDNRDWAQHLLGNYETILKMIRERLPETKVYLMAYYTVNPNIPDKIQAKFMLQVRTRENLRMINGKVAELAEQYGYHFIDVNDGLTDAEGYLKAEYTIEGVHMYANAYRIVFDNLKRYL